MRNKGYIMKQYFEHQNHANDDDDDDEEHHMTIPPCPIAQQLVGCMFGFLIGYTSYVIFGKGIIALFSISFGISFGILGSRSPDKISIEFKEWVQLCFLCFLVSIPFSSLLYFDLFGMLSLSFMVSLLSGHLKFWIDLLNLQHKNKSKIKGQNNTSRTDKSYSINNNSSSHYVV